MTVHEAEPGEQIYYFAKRVVATAKDVKKEQQAKFNDLKFTVYPDSSPIDLTTIYHLLHTIRRLKAGYRD